MKFHEIKKEQWDDVKPFFDTCLIPFGGLNGDESPHEVVHKLDQLRVKMEWIEHPFRGRVVTYPAFQYQFDENNPQQLDQIRHVCEQLRNQGFKFIVAISFIDISHSISIFFDLTIDTKFHSVDAVNSAVQTLWQGNVMNL